MIEVAIMVEGQNGLTWERWQRMAEAVESLGFAGLYRSDHYTNATPPDLDSLELWVSLTWLASHTKRIEFGQLVSPPAFRHPTMMARMASAVDDLSGGRLTLGLGAGWQKREHHNYGLDLLELPARFARLEEGLEVTTRLLQSKGQPVNFAGEYYQLHEATMLPTPKRPGGPPILIGGNGPLRTLPLVARFASEWNAVFAKPSELVTLNARLDELLEQNGRKPADVKRSLMTGCIYGRDEAQVARNIGDKPDVTAASLRESGLVVGTAAQIVEQLGQLAASRVQRVMLQWLDLDDLDGLADMAHQVLPQV